MISFFLSTWQQGRFFFLFRVTSWCSGEKQYRCHGRFLFLILHFTTNDCVSFMFNVFLAFVKNLEKLMKEILMFSVRRTSPLSVSLSVFSLRDLPLYLRPFFVYKIKIPKKWQIPLNHYSYPINYFCLSNYASF